MFLKGIKILVSWPLFLWVILKVHFKYRNKINKKKVIREEDLYKWVRRYSSYLFWIFKKEKITINNLELWGSKRNLIILNKINWLWILYLIKKNNFNKNPPISLFLYKKQTENWPKLIVKYFLLINSFVLISLDNKRELELNIALAVKNIQIPRSLILALDVNRENIKKLLNIAYGGYSKILFIKIEKEKKKINMTIKESPKAKKVITIKPENILKMFDY